MPEVNQSTIVLVPGAWHKADIYSRVTKILDGHGYCTSSLPLPSVGPMPPYTSFDEDVTAIRDCITTLVETGGKEVILTVKSYAGVSGAEALKGLGKKKREENGLIGGVVRLVFINAYEMPEGFQPTARWPEWMRVDLEIGLSS